MRPHTVSEPRAARGATGLRVAHGATVLAGALAATVLAGCGAQVTQAGGRVPIVAAFYPLQYLAERVGGTAVSVSNLVKPGAEPHDIELSARQVATIVDARLVVYLSGFQPAVDQAVTQEAAHHSFDVATVEPLRDATVDETGRQVAAGRAGKDPHVWLDPVRFATIADRLAERMEQADPAHAAAYRTRAAALHADLVRLDAEYAAGLRDCQRHEIITSHAAFGYLAARYHLKQIAIAGLSPDQEPSAHQLAEVARHAREVGATTIFFETLVSPKLAETIAREVGAKAEKLDPIEGLPAGAGGDYLSVMRANLGTLRTALGCA